MACKRRPSHKLQEKLATSLQMSVEGIKLLVNEDYPEQEQIAVSHNEAQFQDFDYIPPNRLIFLGMGILVFVILVSFANTEQIETKNSQMRYSPSLELPQELTPLISGDNITFLKDVTIPDGSSILVNTKFVKIWRIRNIGTVAWKDRYLTRQTPDSYNLCSSSRQVRIKDTPPGASVDIAVEFTTPSIPGSCRTDWKMTDANGNFYFPDAHPLFSVVNVSSQKK